LFIYLTEREPESTSGVNSRGRGRSRLPAEQGAQQEPGSQDPEIMTLAKIKSQTLNQTEPPRHPYRT